MDQVGDEAAKNDASGQRGTNHSDAKKTLYQDVFLLNASKSYCSYIELIHRCERKGFEKYLIIVSEEYPKLV